MVIIVKKNGRPLPWNWGTNGILTCKNEKKIRSSFVYLEIEWIVIHTVYSVDCVCEETAIFACDLRMFSSFIFARRPLLCRCKGRNNKKKCSYISIYVFFFIFCWNWLSTIFLTIILQVINEYLIYCKEIERIFRAQCDRYKTM